MAFQTTTTTTAPGSIPLSTEPTPFPSALPSHILPSFPALTHAQAGHLRHFHNLATQLDGEWRHMGTQDPGQEWLDAYRYQLAMMAYAAGAAHYHRLPALRSAFRTLLEQLIGKMLRREVWGYGYLTSQSGRFVDPDIEELRKPWPDPVRRENIMYSGHLLLMVSLHAMLFDDDKYDAPDALMFDWNPLFWGMGPERFCYNRSSLQKAILDEMERTDWMGVCCEPNSVFIVCNQFPLIAIRYNDVRNGTNVIDGVLDKYRAAWDLRNGFTQGGDQMIAWWRPKQQDFIPGSSIGFSACASAFMNAWNPSYCHATYPSFALGHLTRLPSGRVNLNPPAVAAELRALVADDPATDPHSPATLVRARRRAAAAAKDAANRLWPRAPAAPEFGYVAQWASEVADGATARGVLAHADAFLGPAWERGGLFYPRRGGAAAAAGWDEEGNCVAVDPYTGNAAVGYARLNVRDGQRRMYEEPWGREHFDGYPFVEGVDLGSGVDFLRGAWDGGVGAMVVTVRSWDGVGRRISPAVSNLPAGLYGIYEGGRLVKTRATRGGDDVIDLELLVGGDELDVVLLKQN